LRRIRWTPAAADDLERIAGYLKEHHPSIAHSTVRKLYDAAKSLKQFPHRGRVGQEKDTRELVITSLPYIIVYQVEEQIVNIARVVHASED
jgi:toxin ParE1/3/4